MILCPVTLLISVDRRAIAEMETEADMVVEPDAMETATENVAAEPGPMVTDAYPGPDPGMNAHGGPEPEAMNTADVDTTPGTGG